MPFDFAADQESLAEQAALISGILAASGRQQQDRWRPAIATGGGSRSALPDPDGRAIIGKYEERR